jgi:hypothetical protein
MKSRLGSAVSDGDDRYAVPADAAVSTDSINDCIGSFFYYSLGKCIFFHCIRKPLSQSIEVWAIDEDDCASDAEDDSPAKMHFLYSIGPDAYIARIEPLLEKSVDFSAVRGRRISCPECEWEYRKEMGL